MTGEDLRRFRSAHGFTQRDLAKLLDIPQNTISRWERETHRIEHGKMLTLALAAIADGLAIADV